MPRTNPVPKESRDFIFSRFFKIAWKIYRNQQALGGHDDDLARREPERPLALQVLSRTGTAGMRHWGIGPTATGWERKCQSNNTREEVFLNSPTLCLSEQRSGTPVSTAMKRSRDRRRKEVQKLTKTHSPEIMVFIQIQ